MQAHELFRYFRIPELVDLRQYVRTLPTNTLMGFGAFAALTTFWYATRPKALKPPCDLSMQSVEVAGSGGARRSTLLDGDEPLVYFYDDVRTLYEGFQRGIQVSSKHSSPRVINGIPEAPRTLSVFPVARWAPAPARSHTLGFVDSRARWGLMFPATKGTVSWAPVQHFSSFPDCETHVLRKKYWHPAEAVFRQRHWKC
uniref:Acyl-CoA synthetase long chain family member 1 n=1 Tax=Oryctolagus cuniculus TaxID=9986 RepID=G1SPB6_RABIT